MTKQARILVVDDEPEIGNLLRLFLEDDFDVVTFTDPRLACDEIRSTSYDLVLSDIKMPFLSGLDVVKHVKTVRPSTHVVLITGHAQTEKDKAEAIGLGAAGVLFKPFGDPSKMVEYIQGVLAGVSGGTSHNGSLLKTEGQPTASAPPQADSVVGSSLGSKNQSTAKIKVLIIDDEPDLTDVLTLMLEDDYDITVFNNPAEALKIFGAGNFQIVLTDLNMPQMSGVDVIRQIRKTHPKIPIVVMTGHGEGEPEVVEALSAGGGMVLAKPFPDPVFVLEQLKKILP
jgi:DNA-binding NtrC family response regulator